MCEVREERGEGEGVGWGCSSCYGSSRPYHFSCSTLALAQGLAADQCHCDWHGGLCREGVCHQPPAQVAQGVGVGGWRVLRVTRYIQPVTYSSQGVDPCMCALRCAPCVFGGCGKGGQINCLLPQACIAMFPQYPYPRIFLPLQATHLVAGQTVYLCAPAISLLQAHPYSIADISPAGCDGLDGTAPVTAVVHIKVVGGWSRELRRRLQEQKQVMLQVRPTYASPSAWCCDYCDYYWGGRVVVGKAYRALLVPSHSLRAGHMRGCSRVGGTVRAHQLQRAAHVMLYTAGGGSIRHQPGVSPPEQDSCHDWWRRGGEWPDLCTNAWAAPMPMPYACFPCSIRPIGDVNCL